MVKQLKLENKASNYFSDILMTNAINRKLCRRFSTIQQEMKCSISFSFPLTMKIKKILHKTQNSLIFVSRIEVPNFSQYGVQQRNTDWILNHKCKYSEVWFPYYIHELWLFLINNFIIIFCI